MIMMTKLAGLVLAVCAVGAGADCPAACTATGENTCAGDPATGDTCGIVRGTCTQCCNVGTGSSKSLTSCWDDPDCSSQKDLTAYDWCVPGPDCPHGDGVQ